MRTNELPSDNSETNGARPHHAVIPTKTLQRGSDALAGYKWTTSLLKRWLLGTHSSAVTRKRLQVMSTSSPFGTIAYDVDRILRVLSSGSLPQCPLPMRKIVDETTSHRLSRQSE